MERAVPCIHLFVHMEFSMEMKRSSGAPHVLYRTTGLGTINPTSFTPVCTGSARFLRAVGPRGKAFHWVHHGTPNGTWGMTTAIASEVSGVGLAMGSGTGSSDAQELGPWPNLTYHWHYIDIDISLKRKGVTFARISSWKSKGHAANSVAREGKVISSAGATTCHNSD